MGSFSWSFTKFKNFEVCPKRHYEVDIAKNYVETSEALTWGNEVHLAMEKAVTGKSPLPDTMREYQPWVERYTAARPGEGETYVENKYAITKDFRPTQWKDWNGAWYRGVADLVRLDGPVALAVDWKTGASKNAHDSRQLMLMSQCIFVHYPQVQRIKAEFVWLKEGYSSPEIFNRSTIHQEWPPVLARVAEMENAAKTMNYPPKPGKFCARWCPVSSCVYHGKRHS